MDWTFTSDQTAIARNGPYVFRLVCDQGRVVLFVGYEEKGGKCRFLYDCPIDYRGLRPAMRHVDNNHFNLVHFAWTHHLSAIQSREQPSLGATV